MCFTFLVKLRTLFPPFTCCPSSVLDVQEYKRKQIEEQRQAERLQRQLQQERAYLVSLQQQQQEPPRPPQDKKQLYHYKDQAPGSNDKPAWAKEVTCMAWCTDCMHTICHTLQRLNFFTLKGTKTDLSTLCFPEVSRLFSTHSSLFQEIFLDPVKWCQDATLF